MRWPCALALLLVAGAVHAQPAERNQVRLDLAFSGPGGMIAARYSRVLPFGMRIEPAIGLAYTGVMGSVLVTQPFLHTTTRTNNTTIENSFEVYTGYGVSVLRDGLHHPWTGRESFIPNGNYHWLDFGLSTQNRLPWFLLTTGVGASMLLSSPMNVGGENIEDETFWWIFPEGWMGKQRWVPMLWSSIGWEF